MTHSWRWNILANWALNASSVSARLQFYELKQQQAFIWCWNKKDFVNVFREFSFYVNVYYCFGVFTSLSGLELEILYKLLLVWSITVWIVWGSDKWWEASVQIPRALLFWRILFLSSCELGTHQNLCYNAVDSSRQLPTPFKNPIWWTRIGNKNPPLPLHLCGMQILHSTDKNPWNFNIRRCLSTTTEWTLTQKRKLKANRVYFRQMVPHVSFFSSYTPILQKTEDSYLLMHLNLFNNKR